MWPVRAWASTDATRAATARSASSASATACSIKTVPEWTAPRMMALRAACRSWVAARSRRPASRARAAAISMTGPDGSPSTVGNAARIDRATTARRGSDQHPVHRVADQGVSELDPIKCGNGLHQCGEPGCSSAVVGSQNNDAGAWPPCWPVTVPGRCSSTGAASSTCGRCPASRNPWYLWPLIALVWTDADGTHALADADDPALRVASGPDALWHLAAAVAAGRSGDTPTAEGHLRRAELGFGVLPGFTGYRHIGLRIAAEAAVRDGWGEPGRWLTDAETWSTSKGFDGFAADCRALQRRAGVPQRRRGRGATAVPAALVALGITTGNTPAASTPPGIRIR